MSLPVISAGKKLRMDAGPEEVVVEEVDVDVVTAEGEWGALDTFDGMRVIGETFSSMVGGLAVVDVTLGMRHMRPKSARVTTRSGRIYKPASTSQVTKQGPSMTAWKFQNFTNLSQAKGSGCSSLLMSLSFNIAS